MPIFEDRYRPWVGTAQPRARRLWILAREEFRLIVSGLWMKLAIAPILIVACGMSFLFFIAGSVTGNPEKLLPGYFGNGAYRTNLVFDAILVTALAAVAGSGIIAKDLRTNAIALYFARPIGPADYALGKFLAFLGWMALGGYAPTLLLWGAAFVFRTEDISWGSRLQDLASLTAHSFAIIVPATSAVLALSSLFRWTSAAGVLWVMLYMATGIVGEIGMRLVHNPWMALCSLGEIWKDLGDFLYEFRGDRPAPHPYGLGHLLAVLAGLTAVSWAILALRLRRIEKQ